jgi:hypothetical protein
MLIKYDDLRDELELPYGLMTGQSVHMFQLAEALAPVYRVTMDSE